MADSRRALLLRGLQFGLALVLGLALTGAAVADVKKLRLAYTGWELGTAVAYIGVDSGLFKKHGLEIEEVPMRDTFSAGVQALFGIDLLVGFGNPLAVLQPLMGGAGITVIGSHVSFDEWGMGVNPSVSTVKDLQGKKIGVSGLGTRSDLVARVMLRRAGLEPGKDVELVAAGFTPSRALAVAKNLIQGAPLRAEVAPELQTLGIKMIEVKSVPVAIDLLLTTRSFIKREEDVVRRFMKGYAAAINYFVTRRKESIGILKKYFPTNQAVTVDAMYDSFAAQLRPLPDLNHEALQALVDVTAMLDERAKALKPPDVTEPRFLEELKGSQFLKDLYTEKINL